MKCLIVDDDDFSREIITVILSGYSDVIDAAKNGAEAVHCFEQALKNGSPYNLVCLDILMPVMGGQEALKRMRQLEKAAGISRDWASVIIMTTANTSIQDIQEALWEGDCNDYLVKPVSQADLLALLSKYKLIDQAGAPETS
jgi:two-component system chemotaxis response regulator CheY